MSKFEIQVPKMGESIIEATITKWLKKPGDSIKEDEPIVEIATDKVDSEIPSPVEGILVSVSAKEGDVVAVGTVIAIIDEEGTSAAAEVPSTEKKEEKKEEKAKPALSPEAAKESAETKKEPVKPGGEEKAEVKPEAENGENRRFYSPLVKNIAKQENISPEELESIPGTGLEGRLTKQDILEYLKTRKITKPGAPEAPEPAKPSAPLPVQANDRVIEMDRIRQLIAGHMIRSVQTSAHVTSFVEVDMTNVVQWRERTKDAFFRKENIKLTFTPVFIEVIAKTIRDYPTVNVSVDNNRIILHNNINVGMAVAMPNDNLIVPVIKNADQKNLLGIIKNVTDIADRARTNKLVPDEIAGGTISLTNFGSFGTLMGTPIINQPQTAIVGVGSIKKRPVIIETPSGDTIAIRQMMFLSLTYDHRVIDGALAGKFLNRMQYYFENFDINQTL